MFMWGMKGRIWFRKFSFEKSLRQNPSSEIFMVLNKDEKMDMKEVVLKIVRLNKGLAVFWGNSEGWASIDAANLLSRSRLDWQVSLSESLRYWIGEDKLSDGDLILAWANLGSLVEGTMKLFLSVFYDDY